MGERDKEIEKHRRRILSSLDGMKKQMETFADLFERLGNHLKNAQQSYAEADKRFEKAQDTLGGMLGQAPAQATLPLPDPKYRTLGTSPWHSQSWLCPQLSPCTLYSYLFVLCVKSFSSP